MLDVDLLLAHGVIVTQDDRRRVIQDGAIAIRGDRIVGVGATADLAARYRSREVVDVGGGSNLPRPHQHPHASFSGERQGPG